MKNWPPSRVPTYAASVASEPPPGPNGYSSNWCVVTQPEKYHPLTGNVASAQSVPLPSLKTGRLPCTNAALHLVCRLLAQIGTPANNTTFPSLKTSRSVTRNANPAHSLPLSCVKNRSHMINTSRKSLLKFGDRLGTGALSRNFYWGGGPQTGDDRMGGGKF